MCMNTHNGNDEDIEIDEYSDCSDSDLERLKPVFEKVKLAVEKCDTLIVNDRVKCKHCYFEAKDNNGLNKHMKAKHPTKAS